MKAQFVKQTRRLHRKAGIRKRVVGTAERPRLTVFRSHNHIYVQLIDDIAGVTLCSASTVAKDIRPKVKYGGNAAAAKLVGAAIAEAAKARKVESVAFDRNGYRYHGRIKALADAAREAGLKL
jgi:large subunit ribosomal protein L18